MNKIIYTLAVLGSVLLFGCNRTKPAQVEIQFKPFAQGQEVIIGSIVKNKNALNQEFTTSTLKYLIHGIKLIDVNGATVSLDKHFLIDHKNPALSLVDFGDVPAADYSKISFNVGVDNANNTSGTQDGALDPSNGMFWTWNTGYIFYKHEGTFGNANSPLFFHCGKKESFTGPIELSLNNAKLSDGKKIITVKLHLDKLYDASWDFNVLNTINSDPGEEGSMTKFSSNLLKSFTASVN
jgi:hypothetical protein